MSQFPPQTQDYYVPPAQPSPDGSLRALAICHYVYGALVMLFSLAGIFYIIAGIAIGNGTVPLNQSGGTMTTTVNGVTTTTTMPTTLPAIGGMPPEQFFAYYFVGCGSCIIVVGWLIGILNIVAGRSITRRKRRVFTLIIAGVNCLGVPIGTVLGIFTFVLLLKDNVKAQYDSQTPPYQF